MDVDQGVRHGEDAHRGASDSGDADHKSFCRPAIAGRVDHSRGPALPPSPVVDGAHDVGDTAGSTRRTHLDEDSLA